MYNDLQTGLQYAEAQLNSLLEKQQDAGYKYQKFLFWVDNSHPLP